MCSVSAVSDYFGERTRPTQWTRPMLNEYQEILRRLGELDRKLDQPDCEDPAKLAWMKEVEARLDALESDPEGKSEC